VLQYARDNYSPTGSLHAQRLVVGITCDSDGDVFATTELPSPPGLVVKWPDAHEDVKLLPIVLNSPGPVKVDPDGNLLIVDAGYAVAEFTKDGVATGKSIKMAGNVWVGLAVPPAGNKIYGADATNRLGTEVQFPKGKSHHSYADPQFSKIGGIAFDPG
jgi:hypothetical protein